jgi:uncharacterized protein (DUF305 family)
MVPIRTRTIQLFCLSATLLSAAAPLAFAEDPKPSAQQAAPNAAEATFLKEAEAAFLKENDAAMDKMMAGMEVKPSGDIDRDFTAMMIPHHQGAIDMAQAELRYGKNEQLRRIAQEIIVEQQQEIAAMKLALGDPLPPSVAAPTQASPAVPAPPTESPSASAIHHHDMPNK